MKTDEIFLNLEENRLDIDELNVIRGGKGGGLDPDDPHVLIPD